MGLNYNPTIIPDGLIFFLDAANTRSYPGTGNTTYGIVGGVNGSLVNGVGFTSSNNGSFVFDGSNDVIDLGDNFDMGLSNYSFCTYFKATSNVSNLQGIFSKSIATNAASRYALFIQSGKIYPFMSMGGADVNTPSSLTISTNTWYHVVTVYDRTDKVTLYINGNFDSATTISQFIANDFQATHNFRIGSYSDASNNAAYFLTGSIPQLQIYNRALSATEVMQNYNATKGRFGL